MAKHILVIYTGGTIGMQSGTKDLTPTDNFYDHFSHCLSQYEKKTPSHASWDFEEMDPVVDSANVNLKTWQKLAFIIAEKLEDYDGFIVLHGTDTMAYTAAALSFFCREIKKPIILTGSMRPLLNDDSDAPQNIHHAFEYFNSTSYQSGVHVVFANKVFSGVRASKYNSHKDDAYLEPKGHLASFSHSDIEVVNAQNNALNLLKEWTPSEIVAIPMVPGIQAAYLQSITNLPVQALILILYGSGTAPSADSDFLKALSAANQSGIIIVALTQCYAGHVELSIYQASSILEKAGVLSGGDMTLEAAYAKLQYLIGQRLSNEEIKQKFIENMCGERAY